jgi:hypothetical protein
MGIAMNLSNWIAALMRKFSARPAINNDGADPNERRRALDEKAQDAARVADARLPPHQNSINS